MIITLSIILGSLIIITWVYSLFICWQLEQSVTIKTIETTVLLRHLQKGLRLSRRTWYQTQRQTRQVLGWTRENTTNIFIKILPNSAPLFSKQDKLSGLYLGPTSYFLKKISQPAKLPIKHLPEDKKML